MSSSNPQHGAAEELQPPPGPPPPASISPQPMPPRVFEYRDVVPPSVPGSPILVTGGAGFIGSHTAEQLLRRGERVIIADEVNDYYDVRLKRMNLARLRHVWGEAKVKIYEGDLCDEQFVSEIFANEAPLKRVVHLAARAGVRPSIADPFIYIHSNLTATTRLLEACRKGGCDHFVYASSSSVYGESRQEVGGWVGGWVAGWKLRHRRRRRSSSSSSSSS